MADTPYQMWIPFKRNKITPPDPQLERELHQNWLEIENWVFDNVGTTNLPFIVVASDGSGDFTSIKDAVDAAAAGTTKPTAIYVKPTALTYTDTSAVTVGGKNVFIFSFGPDTHSSTARIEWNFQGFDYSTNCVVSIYGIDLTQNGTAHDFCNPTSSRLDLSLEHVDATSWTSGSASFMPTSAAQPTGTWSLIDARLPRLRAGTGTVAINVNALRSSFTATASSTLTMTGSQCWEDCELDTTGANANLLFTSVAMELVGCTFSSLADGNDPNITHKPSPATATKACRSTLSACVSFSSNPGTITIDHSVVTAASTTYMSTSLAANSLANWTVVTIGPALAGNLIYSTSYISGSYSKVTIGQPATRADLQLIGAQNPALTINSDGCAVYAAGQGFTPAAGQGYLINGNKNILDFAGAGAVATGIGGTYGAPTASVDAGVGNIVRQT